MNIKKILLCFLCAAMVLPFAACRPAVTPDDSSAESTSEAEVEESAQAEETSAPDESVAESEPECESESNSETERDIGVNILADPTFQNGFKLINTREEGGGVVKILPARDGSTDHTSWMVAQWWNNNLLQNGTETVTDTTYSIKDASKEVAVDWEKGMLTLTLNASQELTAPSATKWPHLLLEQSIPATSLKDTESVTATITYNIVENSNKTQGAALHAQFAWFIYISDTNPESEGNGNFLWFGLNLFNSQTISTSLYHAQDMAGGPGNYIYSLGTSSFLDTRMWVGRPIEVECDILPYIAAALDQAHKDGFMIGTDIEDVSIIGMNIGWENFDRWDETVTIENLGIYVK